MRAPRRPEFRLRRIVTGFAGGRDPAAILRGVTARLVTTRAAGGILIQVAPYKRITDRAIYDSFVLGSPAHHCTAGIQPVHGPSRRPRRTFVDRPGLCLLDFQSAADQADWTQSFRARRLGPETGGVDLFHRHRPSWAPPPPYSAAGSNGSGRASPCSPLRCVSAAASSSLRSEFICTNCGCSIWAMACWAAAVSASATFLRSPR